ncbi:LysR substrate-binding domain-containing protein [Cohaesibacter intestini]|uniref:LysR substrate-binding domain-containing protein n=1 Tax=Cohaesibacter intestini TaxID=2211145 RepID=UPI000DE86367|nr:LysR substrate-binding domain-containing protein [Cohaesibacter intestini]
MLPPLNALRAFEAAGRHLTFRAAADELHVTQGAVAQQVRQLEAHFGVPLFERHAKGLAFTQTGRSYHARIAAIFLDLHDATRQVLPEQRRVVISATPTFTAKWLIPHLPDFSRHHAEIELQFLATENVSSLINDQVDIAIRQGNPPFGAALEATLLFRHQLIAVAAPQLVAMQDLPLSPEALAQLPKLHDAHNGWPSYLKAMQLEDCGAQGLRFSQTSLALDAALAGQGVALVSAFLVKQDLAEGRLVRVSDQKTDGGKDFYLLTPKQALKNEVIETVCNWIASHAEIEVQSSAAAK